MLAFLQKEETDKIMNVTFWKFLKIALKGSGIIGLVFGPLMLVAATLSIANGTIMHRPTPSILEGLAVALIWGVGCSLCWLTALLLAGLVLMLSELIRSASNRRRSMIF